MGKPVEEFNDTHTRAEVLAAFDRAIELAEQETAILIFSLKLR